MDCPFSLLRIALMRQVYQNLSSPCTQGMHQVAQFFLDLRFAIDRFRDFTADGITEFLA